MEQVSGQQPDALELFSRRELMDRGDRLEAQIQMAVNKIKHLEAQINSDQSQIRKLTSQLIESSKQQGTLSDENYTLRSHLEVAKLEREAESKLRSKVLNDLKSTHTVTKSTIASLQADSQNRVIESSLASSRAIQDQIAHLNLEGRNDLLEHVVRLECSLSDMHDLAANLTSKRSQKALENSQLVLDNDILAVTGLLESNTALTVENRIHTVAFDSLENLTSRYQSIYGDKCSFMSDGRPKTQKAGLIAAGDEYRPQPTTERRRIRRQAHGRLSLTPERPITACAGRKIKTFGRKTRF